MTNTKTKIKMFVILFCAAAFGGATVPDIMIYFEGSKIPGCDTLLTPSLGADCLITCGGGGWAECSGVGNNWYCQVSYIDANGRRKRDTISGEGSSPCTW